MEVILNFFLKIFVWVGLVVVFFLVWLFNRDIKKFILRIIFLFLGCLELFLFCKIDFLVLDKDVWVFIEVYKNKNIKVFLKCWEVSGYV